MEKLNLQKTLKEKSRLETFREPVVLKTGSG